MNTTTPTDRRRGGSRATLRSTPLPLGPGQLREARFLAAFRQALARRRVDDRAAFHLPNPHSFLCWPCFQAGVEALGRTLHVQPPLPGEEGAVEPYRALSWTFDRAERGDPCDEGADDDDGDEPSTRAANAADEPSLTHPAARFYADKHRGLYALRGADEGAGDLWLWLVYHDDDGPEACAAGPRDVLSDLLSEIERRHREHERRFAGLILVGNNGEAHAERQRVTWDDLVLPTQLAAELRQTVEEFFAAAPLYRRHGLPHRRGLLLAGPPGNGKTSIIKAIGATTALPVVVATLDDPHQVHNTRTAFQRATQLAPAVLCFEDLDALVGDGPGLSQFLNQLDGLEPLEGVLVVATTNRADRIDPAIAKRPSRFDRVFLIPDPDRAQREAYLERLLDGDGPAHAARELSEATSGYSMAFLKELVLQARLTAVRRRDERLSSEDLRGALAATSEHLQLAARGLEDRGRVGF